jgi:prevent-host-death family protein
MITVGVREFKNRATELLRLVESGKEEVVVTRHSKPVARLVVVSKAAPDSQEAILDRLHALGIVRKGDGKPFNKNWKPIKARGKPGSQIIIEEREDRF